MSTPTPETFDIASADLPDATDADGFPLSYADPEPQPQEPTVSTATAEPDAPAVNGAPKKVKKEKVPKAPKAPKATGEKPVRRPRTYGAYKEPAGVLKTLPLDGLTFHRHMQSRSGMFDEETVERYKALYQDNPDVLPPIRAVDIGEDEAEKRKTSRYIVWDGFQRGRARREARLASIPVLVTTGTWTDAIRFSLAANSTHGMPRSSADLRRAFQHLIGDEELLAEAIKAGRGKGGPQVGIARAINVSHGLVGKLLKDAGLRVRGEKLVAKSQTDKPERHTRTEEDPGPAMRVESPEAIKSRNSASVIKEVTFAAAQIQRRFESLIERDDVANLLRETFNKHGVPTTRDETPGKGGKVIVTEYWPAIDSILRALEELAEQHAAMNTARTN